MSLRWIGLVGRWLAVLSGLWAFACAGDATTAGSPMRDGALRVVRGDFEDRFVLTGELEAARGDTISVPRVPSWQVGIKWIETDGNEVRQGQKVIELDNSEFTGNLKEKESTAIKARHDLARDEAQKPSDLGDKQLELERKRLDLEKAKIEATVPESLRSRRDYQDKQLALKRAEVEFAKATDDLAALRKAAAADLANLRLALEKAEREIRVAEDAIRTTTLHAPRDGIFLVSEHPWEGRKLQVGDSAWVGMRLATLPDLSSLQAAASLSDVDDGRVRPGQSAVAILDAYPDNPIAARIVEVGHVAQEAAPQSLRRTIRVVAKLERADPGRLRPGLSLRLVVSRERRAGVLLAPREALDLAVPEPRARLASGRFVPVRLGPCNALVCVVEDGLAKGVELSPTVPISKGGA